MEEEIVLKISSIAYIYRLVATSFFLILFSLPRVYLLISAYKPWNPSTTPKEKKFQRGSTKTTTKKNVNASQDQIGTKLDEPIKSKLLVNYTVP